MWGNSGNSGTDGNVFYYFAAVACLARVIAGGSQTMMSPDEYSVAFQLVDDYAGMRHNCFLAELFLNETKTEYTFVFSPRRLQPGCCHSL
jgi:hypothetical protein